MGDLAGIRSRLDHLEWLGVDAIWLSPIYPSPQHDFGYDIADYEDIDPGYGTLAEFDALLEDAHGRDIKLLMDLVPCHTSIEHPWFRDRPDFYVWREGPEPPNNWKAAFGGSAWSWDEERGAWYLHSFYPEQPDLDWTNPRGRGGDAGRRALLDRPRHRRLPPRRDRPHRQGPAVPRRPAAHRARHLPDPPPRVRDARPPPLEEHRRGEGRAGGDPRGGRRRGLPDRRDLPAGDRLAALPREPRHRLRLPAVPRAAAVGARPARRDRRRRRWRASPSRPGSSPTTTLRA